METRWEVHLAAAGLTALFIGAIVLFFSFPRLLVYLLLAIVAALAYGALYLILAARMDPRQVPATVAKTEAPPPSRPRKKRAPRKKAAKKKRRARSGDAE